MKIGLALFGLVVLYAQSLLADFRCPSTGKIVSEGMTAYEVEAACGSPSAKNRLNTDASLTGLPAVEEWTYDFGSARLLRKLRFEGGVLKSEEVGSYGTEKSAKPTEKK